MLRTIRSRLIVSYLLVALLAMAVAGALAWSALDVAFLDVLRENLLAQARRVAQTVEAGGRGLQGGPLIDEAQPDPGPYSQVSNVLPGYHTRVIDEAGAVVLDLDTIRSPEVEGAFSSTQLSQDQGLATSLDISAGGEGHANPLPSRPEIQSALGGEASTAVRTYSWSPGRRVLYAAYPVVSLDGTVTGVVYIASPLPRLSLSLLPSNLGPQVLGGIVLATVLAGVAGVFLSRTLTHPLARLTTAASALARGDKASPLPAAATRELNRLTEAFNTMNTNLTSARDSLAAGARQREAILNGLADAVVAASGTGEIVVTNPAGAMLLKTSPEPIYDAIRGTLTDGQAKKMEFSAQDRVFELVTTPLTDDGCHIRGVVTVGHDVTAYRQLDRLRTHFVSDVSHELRTPLTSIKGFVETLRDGAAEDPALRSRFLGTIASETERLIRLASDLLLLTRADTGRLDLNLAPTDIVASVQRAVGQLAGRARAKGVALGFVPPDDTTLAWGDADRLHQVLINLLDNAVKFTPSGGRVVISVDRSGDQATCTVSDTGPGIATDQLPHLFERFYRGDHSRTRGKGESGAGLGLAIAKAIVEAHGGRIWVESEPGRGSAVTFTLPAHS